VFPISQRLAQGVLAMVMAADGEVLEAERLARDAVSFFTESDLVLDHAMALTSLGEVLRLAGRPTDAAATVEQAMDLYVRKGDVVSARRARTLRDQLAAAAQHERAPGHPSGRGRVNELFMDRGLARPGRLTGNYLSPVRRWSNRVTSSQSSGTTSLASANTTS
jgi:hypothetical protein